MRKSKEDWLKAGLKILGQGGVNGLTIERMKEELEVTKGSFYHHFKSMRDFEERLIAYWADQYQSTTAGFQEFPEARLALLDQIMEETFAPITEPEIAIRAWALQDEMVRQTVEQVDQLRRAFVLNVFQAEVGPGVGPENDPGVGPENGPGVGPEIGDGTRARLMTDMLYTILIGSITALPRIPPDRVLELYREFKRLYGLGD